MVNSLGDCADMAVAASGRVGCVFAGCVAKDGKRLLEATGPLWKELTLFEPPDGGFETAGEAPVFNLADVGVSVKSYLDRTSSLTLMAVGLALGSKRNSEFGLAFGTRWGALSSMKMFFEKVKQNPRFAPPLLFSHSYANSPASAAAIEYGLKGWHCVFSDGDASGVDALTAALEEAERTGATIIAAAAEALSPELYAYYHSLGAMGLPSKNAPDKFVPGEAAVAMLVKPSGAGRTIESLVEDEGRTRLKDAEALVLTDACSMNSARSYEQLVSGWSGVHSLRVIHVGLITGNTGAAGGLLAAAAALFCPSPALVLAGGIGNLRLLWVQ